MGHVARRWASELERWLPAWLRPRDLRVVRSALDAPPPPPAPTPRITVISFHMLERLRELDADGPFLFRSVVVDEAHVAATRTSRVGTRAESAQTRKVVALVKRATHLALLLTGTPCLGRPLGLFPLLDALACGGDRGRQGDAGCAPQWFPAATFAERKLAFCREFCGARKFRGDARRAGDAVYDAEPSRAASNERTNEGTKERRNERTNERTNEWTHIRKSVCF